MVYLVGLACGGRHAIAAVERLRKHGIHSVSIAEAAIRMVASFEPSALGFAFAALKRDLETADNTSPQDLGGLVKELVERAASLSVLSALVTLEPRDHPKLFRAAIVPNRDHGPFGIRRVASPADTGSKLELTTEDRTFDVDSLLQTTPHEAHRWKTALVHALAFPPGRFGHLVLCDAVSRYGCNAQNASYYPSLHEGVRHRKQWPRNSHAADWERRLMQDEQTSVDRLATLVRDVFHLRTIMRHNKLDAALSQRGVHLHYMFDPDVLDLYVQPGAWLEAVSALPSLRKSELQKARTLQQDDGEPASSISSERPLPSATILEATALLTGEYIFGRQLVGAHGRLYIAPEHMADFIGHVARIEARTQHAVRRVATIGDELDILRSKLNYEKRKSAQKHITADAWLSQSRKLLVEGLAAVSHSALLASHRLERLLSKNILANAASHGSFTSDIIAPDVDKVMQLGEEIRDEKSCNVTLPSKEAIELDAVTLAQLMMLNEDYRERKNAFLLITRDRGLHAVYSKWVRSQSQAGASQLYALRFPRQYIPILNVFDMGGYVTTHDVFSTLARAIDDVVALFSSTELPGETDDGWQADDRDRDFRQMLRRHERSPSLARFSYR